jgi:uncharacterized membrane protein
MSKGNGNGEKPRPPSKPTEGIAEPPRNEIIPPALESALKSSGVDLKDPNVFRALEISLTMMFTGSLPLPPPAILKEYGNIRPELVDMLVKLTEEQSVHRRDMERKRTEGSETRLNRSQWIGATVALGGLALAAVVSPSNTIASVVLAIAGVGGPTAAIWLARNMKTPSPPTHLSPPSMPKPPHVS